MKRWMEFLNENLFTPVSQPDRDLLYRKINELKRWLHLPEGLDLRNVIDKIFREYGYVNQLTPEEIEQFGKGLEALNLTDMSNSYITWKLNQAMPYGIEKLTLVRDANGDWDFLNKLNTNYTALAELLTELIMRGIEYNKEKGMAIYEKVIANPQEGLMSIKKYLERLIVLYFIERGRGLDDFRMFTLKIKELSKLGEEAEETIAELLRENGFEVVYQGGNGDFIDMIFGCDMIVKHEKWGYKSVQVKDKFPGWKSLSHYKVDWLGLAYPNIELIDFKTQQPVRL